MKDYNNNDENENKILFYNFIIQYTRLIKNNYLSHKKHLFLYYILITLDINFILNNFLFIKNNINSYKPNTIFNSHEEYHKRTDNISSKSYLLLTNFNFLTVDLSKLRSKVQKEKEAKKKEILKINQQNGNIIKTFEEKLKILKSQYYNNLKEIQNAKTNFKDKKNNVNILDEKINLITTNIMSYNIKKISLMKEDETPTMIENVNYCEKVILYLLKYKKEVKAQYPEKYNKIIKDIKVEKMIKRLKNREETMKQIVNLKMKKIYDNNNKILLLPYRKINEKKNKKKKKVKSKQ